MIGSSVFSVNQLTAGEHHEDEPHGVGNAAAASLDGSVASVMR